MNSFDNLIDSMVEVMEDYLGDTAPDYWHPAAKEAAYRILDIVEEYKEDQPQIKSWRASD